MPVLQLSHCFEIPEHGRACYGHGDQCRAGWRKGTDGWWRWFWASVRCVCPCHSKPQTKAGAP